MKRTPWTIALLMLALAFSSANAALNGRLPATPGGTDYQAYYDTSTNLVWVASANLAQTSAYDADGLMTWTDAQAWIASLNAQNGGLGYLGVNNWRLPTVTDSGTPGCNFAYTGTDCGYNVAVATGEMARMYYSTLGNNAYYNAIGVPTGCSGPTICLTNMGPFSNLKPFDYWSGTQYSPDTSRAWVFFFQDGRQDESPTVSHYYAWAVREGDVDSDGDVVQDFQDNCTLVANPTQVDSDQDGYGNACDGDLNNSGGNVNAFDTPLFRAQQGQPSVAPTYNAADINASGGTVNAFDTPLFRALIGKPPGPSGLACAGTVPCP